MIYGLDTKGGRVVGTAGRRWVVGTGTMTQISVLRTRVVWGEYPGIHRPRFIIFGWCVRDYCPLL